MTVEHKKLATEVATGRMASGLRFGQWNEKETIALACEMLAAQGHSETLAGQITVRSEENTFLTTPMAVGFDEVTPDDIIRVDANMDVIEGAGMANPAMRFHVWIYRARPDVNCIIHTHPPFVSALAMTGRKLKVAHMDATPFANDCGYLGEWPGLPIADHEGELISGALGSYRSVLLRNHGFLCATSSIEETTYLSILIERAAKAQLTAEAVGPVEEVDAELAKESHDFLLLPHVVRSSFAMFARRVIRNRVGNEVGNVRA